MSSFFPDRIVNTARENCARHPWAAAARDGAVRAAEPWERMSDDALWDLMFGHTITRSWMVWSNGFCPSCRRGVPMYQWVIEPLALPWKVRCPHCHDAFPKNDFAVYHRSGLDEHLVFDPARADRSLLYNTEHPGASDPLRSFGVDDGEGYVEAGNRWRFIGAYLIYGQWKRHILADGRKDVFVCAAEVPIGLPEIGLCFRGGLGWARLSPKGAVMESRPEGAWSRGG
jgi:oligo-alginate lyase